jgi:LacI family transcriptional regulator
MRPGRSVTIMDVAREAGVSYATVSRVVNNKNSILPDKRARVLEAMERLGYTPNLQARSLAGGRSQVVGLGLHDVCTSYAFEILRGIDAELAAADYDLMLYTSRQRAAKESAHVAALTRGLAEGLLLLLPRNLGRYLERLRPALGAVRGVLAAQAFTQQARTLAAARGIHCVALDYDALRGIEPKTPTLF